MRIARIRLRPRRGMISCFSRLPVLRASAARVITERCGASVRHKICGPAVSRQHNLERAEARVVVRHSGRGGGGAGVLPDATFTVRDLGEPGLVQVPLVEMLMAVQDQINAMVYKGRLERGRLIS